MKKSLLVLVLLISLSVPTAQAANPKAGSACSRLGMKVAFKAKTYTCVKSGKKRVWNKGVANSKKPSPAPSNSSTDSSSNTSNTNAPNTDSTSGTVLFDAGANGVVRSVSSSGGKAQPMNCANSDGNQGFRSQRTIFVDPKNPKHLSIAIEYMGFYVSDDGGTTWNISSAGLIGYPKESNSKLPCHTEFSAMAVDPQDSSHLILARAGEPGTIRDYFSENAGLYESEDAGGTWKQILTQEGLGVYVHDGLAISHQNSQVIYAGTTTNARTLGNVNIVYPTKGIIYKTVNGGKSWVELPTGVPANTGVQAISIDPENENVVTVSTFGRVQGPNGPTFGPGLGIIRTTDGGQTWMRLDSLEGGFSTIEFSQINPKYVLGNTYDSKVLSSDDGGATWKALSGVGSLRAINFDTTDLTGTHALLADGSGAITLLSNNGATLVKAGILPSLAGHSTRVTQFAFGSDGVWYAAGHYTNGSSHQEGFVFKTNNAGATWLRILDTNSLK